MLSKTPCSSRVPRPSYQYHVQTAFEYLQAWRFHSLSWQPVPAQSQPHSEKAFTDTPYFYIPVCAHCCCLVTEHHTKAWLCPLCTLQNHEGIPSMPMDLHNPSLLTRFSSKRQKPANKMGHISQSYMVFIQVHRKDITKPAQCWPLKNTTGDVMKNHWVMFLVLCVIPRNSYGLSTQIQTYWCLNAGQTAGTNTSNSTSVYETV